MTDNDFYCMHSEMCKTLANPKRQQIIDTLRDQEMTVSEIVELTDLSQSNVSQHLSILRSTGVVQVRRTGRAAHYRLTSPKIIEAFDLITEVMREGLQHQNDVATKTIEKIGFDPRLIPDA